MEQAVCTPVNTWLISCKQHMNFCGRRLSVPILPWQHCSLYSRCGGPGSCSDTRWPVTIFSAAHWVCTPCTCAATCSATIIRFYCARAIDGNTILSTNYHWEPSVYICTHNIMYTYAHPFESTLASVTCILHPESPWMKLRSHRFCNTAYKLLIVHAHVCG